MSDSDIIRFEPLVDPIFQQHGFPARSPYVEFCYAGIIGPSAMLALRLATAMLEGAGGEPVTVDADELARSLGLGGGTGPNSKIQRTLHRLERFELARPRPDGYGIHLYIPPLSRARQLRATTTVQRIHERLMARRQSEADQAG